MGLHESHWSPLASAGLRWSPLVYGGLRWSPLVFAGRPSESQEDQWRLMKTSWGSRRSVETSEDHNLGEIKGDQRRLVETRCNQRRPPGTRRDQARPWHSWRLMLSVVHTFIVLLVVCSECGSIINDIHIWIHRVWGNYPNLLLMNQQMCTACTLPLLYPLQHHMPSHTSPTHSQIIPL